jgi:hypothetical protein
VAPNTNLSAKSEENELVTPVAIVTKEVAKTPYNRLSLAPKRSVTKPAIGCRNVYDHRKDDRTNPSSKSERLSDFCIVGAAEEMLSLRMYVTKIPELARRAIPQRFCIR